MKKWKCIYVSGSGKKYDEGIFVERKKTNKVLTLEMIEEGFFANYPDIKIRRIPIGKGKETRFCPSITEFDDGDIIVYHNQDGTPYTYSPMKGKK